MIPLHGAAAEGHIEVMKYLIQKGSDVNRDDEDGWTPFSAAVKNGHLEAVKHLLRKGAVQKRYDGMTPLYIAAQAGHLDVVKLLISNGADVNEVDDEGMIALHAAARKGNIEIVKYLIQQGSDVSREGNNGLTPLNAAITEGHLKVVEFFMAKGAKCVSTESISPLYIATQYNHIEVVKFLVSKGYNVNEGTKSGKSPLHAACYNGNIDMIDFLLLNNADVDKQDQDGWTPLQAAAQEDHLQVVAYLTVRGAHIKDTDGITSIQASQNKSHSTLRIKGISSTDVSAQIASRDQQYKSRQNAITAEDATASLAEPAQSCTTHTKQSKLLVHNIHDENAFIHAEIEEESWDGQSLKALPTATHHHEDDANVERTPFFGAQPKSPDTPEHDLTQNHMEAIDDIRIRKRNNQTNNIGFPNSSGHQKWQYSGFDPPFLPAQNNSMNSGQISEDPESRWHLLTEEIGQTRMILALKDHLLQGCPPIVPQASNTVSLKR
nr:ankyrin-1-like [Lytechinus pictus]